ncbi:MAG: hypothetical protein U5J64_07210 [Halobacteriales archaeon]|nr:hypothetical protein [Halobacteriales archaeon]
MVVFLADRSNLQTKRLHDRIKQRVRSEFVDVRRRRTEPRESGAYRVVGETDPRAFLGAKEYPVKNARIEIGFRLRTDDTYEHYWINWVEPERNALVGWHQDDTHDNLGPVHLQMNRGSDVVAREPAEFLDSHPLDVVGRRVDALKNLVPAVDFEEGRL